MTPADLRALCRKGDFTSCTAAAAPGYVQANLVVVPGSRADGFAEFCRRNSGVFPVLEKTEPGDPDLYSVAAGADLRTDLPSYQVFRDGVLSEECTDILDVWRDDLVGFVTGCSFTFDSVLASRGIPVRHVEQERNISMYATTVPCRSGGGFEAKLVVTMRPIPAKLVPEVQKVSARYPLAHGAPLHAGDPASLGIADLARPDYGEAPALEDGDVPVFWRCGVTAQSAIGHAKPDLCITHAPGAMLVTDLECSEIEDLDSIEF